MRVTVSFVLLATLASLAAAVAAAPANGNGSSSGRQKSVIQLISDGFGPASETFARSFVQARDNLQWNDTLPLDKSIVGTIRTRSTDSLVTDSAASATAYSCGIKSVNAYIGVDIDQKPCGTVLEAAKQKGYNTALVTTSRSTHATPASYAAHVPDRDDENTIAEHMLGGTVLGARVDLIWGGGRRHFLPNTTSGSSRKDGRDLIGEATSAGWSYLSTRAEFDALNNGSDVQLPSLGLFTSSHMSYEIDRLAQNSTVQEPSLAQMAITALNALKKQDEPFFIMIEGARIDHAGHNNDPIGHLHDILAYQELWTAVSQWVDANDASQSSDDPEIVLLSTSDHECGGLTLALQRPEDEEAEYAWYPDVLNNSTHSTEYLAAQFYKYAEAENRTDGELRDYMVQTILPSLGQSDIDEDETARALELAKEDDDGLALTIYLASLVNWRAHLGWSTTGHSGLDVNLYLHVAPQHAQQKLAASFVGNHENTWIGSWTASWLELDLTSVTRQLNNGTLVGAAGEGSANLTTPTGRYHGGPKHVLPALPPRRRGVGYSHRENTSLRAEERSHSMASKRRAHAEL
ncbi:alkaline phosphatase [Ceraceosorus bombacis]|uniref:Alkaline phosphatase n=1 Tax=Ceraceosorus bombacis TaxID=401625 RepID=A0A0P1BNC1_9BASI|nr:alkaline phosphatase [Ceraceosorus bombacis]